MPEFLAHQFSTLPWLLVSHKESMLNLFRLLKSVRIETHITLQHSYLCSLSKIVPRAARATCLGATCSHAHDFQQLAYRFVQQRLSPLDLGRRP